MQVGRGSPAPCFDLVPEGLYIVEEFVRAHGGTVQVQSTADDGTTFACVWHRPAIRQRVAV